MAVIKGKTGQTLEVDNTSEAARVTLYDTLGNPIMVETGYEGNKYLGVCMNQDVESSTKNSSIAAIASGATWSGAAETTLGIAGIQVGTFIDRPHTVTVYQATVSGHWDISDSWDVPASFGVSRTVQATGVEYYVAVKNNGGTTSTVTRIGTALCPVVEALPRALTSGGNLKVSVQAEWQGADRTTGLYATSTFMTVGLASSPHNIFSIENPAASLLAMAIRGLNFTSDNTGAVTAPPPQVKLSRPAVLPTGGTVLVPSKYRSTYGTCGAVLRGATASDGGGATAITATAAVTLWSQFLDRQHTNVGLITHVNYNLIPDVGADLRQIILLPGESILVQIIGNSVTTANYIVNCSWIEFKYL